MINQSDLYVDIGYRQINCYGDQLCGDSFMKRYLPNEQRTVMVLSDGMGHGVKANILSTLTASIFMGMAGSGDSVQSIAQKIIKTLPVCSIRKISYSTFTLVDINHHTGQVEIIEFDNPQSMLFRGAGPLPCDWDCLEYDDPNTGESKTLLTTSFVARHDDRIVLMSDGVTQSGLGSSHYPFGWGAERIYKFVRATLDASIEIKAEDMAYNITNVAVENDQAYPKDDITCAVVHFRHPRRLLLCSCPPSLHGTQEHKIADMIHDFDGRKVVCDYPLAEAMATRWGVSIAKDPTATDPDVPPQWRIDGIDLVTEGLITLSKALETLTQARGDSISAGRGPAYHVCEELLAADVVRIVIGLRHNDNGSSRGQLLRLQRKNIESIARLLESRFSKQVIVSYL